MSAAAAPAATNQPVTNQPATNQPATNQPAGSQPTGTHPAGPAHPPNEPSIAYQRRASLQHNLRTPRPYDPRTNDVRTGSLSPPPVPPDAELIAATRNGGTAAFEELYHRHVVAARRLARSLCRDAADVEDLVAETFARVLASLRAGNGPDQAFRPYLLTTLRHVCYDRTRRDKRVELTGDINAYEKPEAFVDPTITGLERSFAARAFAKLPERWRAVLWHTEVEGNSHAQVASRLGLTPNGVSALAFRARERLRQMYLQEHLTDATDAACRETANRLGAYVRRGLATRDQVKVDAHLRSCPPCQRLSAELSEVNSALHSARGPIG